MKIVVDTSVLVSAVVHDRKPEAAIKAILGSPDLHWMVSAEIVAEYEQVLARPKFHLDADEFRDWVSLVRTNTVLVQPAVEFSFPRDRKDAKFLACATVCQADYLLTGDRDFSEAQQLVATHIISVSAFLELFGERLPPERNGP